MANTATYRHPPPHQFPPAAECTVEDLLDIAARTVAGAGHELMSSSPHVEAICRLVQDQALELDDVRAELLAERDQLQALTLDLEAARKSAQITTVMVRITGKSLEELAHEDAIEEAAEREHERAIALRATRTLLERQRAVTHPIAQRSIVEAAYRSQPLLFDVSDTEIVDTTWLEGERTRDIPAAAQEFA